jgi:hypothetical protein
MTSATSAGVAMWMSSGRRATSWRTASVTQPVSVTGGWTMLAVTPWGASSSAADMV